MKPKKMYQPRVKVNPIALINATSQPFASLTAHVQKIRNQQWTAFEKARAGRLDVQAIVVLVNTMNMIIALLALYKIGQDNLFEFGDFCQVVRLAFNQCMEQQPVSFTNEDLDAIENGLAVHQSHFQSISVFHIRKAREFIARHAKPSQPLELVL